jgi:hypothetical protein
MVQAEPGQKANLISKIARAKRAGVMDQALECLSCKREALSSNLSTTKKKEEEKERGWEGMREERESKKRTVAHSCYPS